MKLGIIGAMELEVETLREQMKDRKSTIRSGSTFYEGTLRGLPVVVVQCGVGKVNAAICTQLLCDCFGVTHLVNTGIAGSLCAELDIGDLVVSEGAVYHDFDCTVFGYAPGQVPGTESARFKADQKMQKFAFSAAEQINPGHTRMGCVASGDQFVCGQEQKDLIVERTNAICTEMEGAAIAHTAQRNGVPFVILRAISDKADHSAEMDYPSFEKIAAHRCAEVVTSMAQALGQSDKL